MAAALIRHPWGRRGSAALGVVLALLCGSCSQWTLAITEAECSYRAEQLGASTLELVLSSCASSEGFNEPCCSQLNSLFGTFGELGLCLCYRKFLQEMLDVQQREYVESGLGACGTPFSGAEGATAECAAIEPATPPAEVVVVQPQGVPPDAISLPSAQDIMSGLNGIIQALPDIDWGLPVQQQTLPDEPQANEVDAQETQPQAVSAMFQPTLPVIRFGRYEDKEAAVDAAEEGEEITFRLLPSGRLQDSFQPGAQGDLSSQYARVFINPFDIAGRYPRPAVMYDYDYWGQLVIMEALYPVM